MKYNNIHNNIKAKNTIQHHFTVGGKGAIFGPYKIPYKSIIQKQTHFSHFIINQTFCDCHTNGHPEILSQSLMLRIMEEVISLSHCRKRQQSPND
jgi:hypothetical protein